MMLGCSLHACSFGAMELLILPHTPIAMWVEAPAAGTASVSLREPRHPHGLPTNTTQECGSASCVPDFQQSVSRARIQRGVGVRTLFARRQLWKQESLVNGRVSKRAMHAVKEIRLLDDKENATVVLDKWVKSMAPVRRDFLDLLQEFGESKEDRKQWLKLMEWALQQECFEANVRDYTKLLKVYGMEGRIQDATILLSDMESLGILPTVVTYTVLIGIYCKQGQIVKAKEIFEELSGLGLVPDVKAYNNLILGYAHAALLKEAKALLEDMEVAGIQPNVDSYTALINGHGRLGEVDQAQTYFDLMQFKGIRPNPKAFTALLDAYGRALEPHAAREVFNNFLKLGFDVDDRVLALMIAAYERRGLLDEAVNLIVELEKVKVVPGVESWSILVGWFVRAGLMEEAEQIVEDLSKNYKHVSHQGFADIYKLYKKQAKLDTPVTSEIFTN